MTVTVDLARLAAEQGPKVLLASGHVGESGTGTDYVGFGDVDSVYFEVQVRAVDRSRYVGPSLAVALQESADGDSWSTLETLTFTDDGLQGAEVTTSEAHLRAVWTVTGPSVWSITFASVAPALLNEAGGGGNGGSQPGTQRWLDLGLVAVGDLDTAPITLYTPAVDELVTDVRLRDFTYTDVTDSLFGVFSGVRYGPIAWVGHNADNVRDAPAQAAAGLGQLADNEADISTQSFVRITASDPLIAAFSAHDSGEQAALAWTANTAKDGTPVAVNVIGAGHIWTSQDSGDTGGSPPDFAGNIGGSVVDGDITWTDAYAIPAAGEARILIAVTTPDPYP